jgi:hypothetical protein
MPPEPSKISSSPSIPRSALSFDFSTIVFNDDCDQSFIFLLLNPPRFKKIGKEDIHHGTTQYE